jgi:hypothetical protein
LAWHSCRCHSRSRPSPRASWYDSCRAGYSDAGPVSVYYPSRRMLPAKTRAFVRLRVGALSLSGICSAGRRPLRVLLLWALSHFSREPVARTGRARSRNAVLGRPPSALRRSTTPAPACDPRRSLRPVVDRSERSPLAAISNGRMPTSERLTHVATEYPIRSF